jgi:hypothetical protein
VPTSKHSGLFAVKRSIRWWLAIVALPLAIYQVWLVMAPSTQTHGVPKSQLDVLHSACIQDMVANTCKVMGTAAGATSSAPAKPGDLVFIAGVGAIAAADYQQIYAAGDAMCTVVRDACGKDWDAQQCLTARKLWQPK